MDLIIIDGALLIKPAPVLVKNWPPPDVAALHWAQAGVWIALGALVVAIATLGLVAWQIYLARRTLTLTEQELMLTKDALQLAQDELWLTKESLVATTQSNEMVRESLIYAREQAQLIARRAHLQVFTMNRVKGVLFQGSAFVPLYVVNRGEKVATSAVLRLLLPSVFGYAPGYNPTVHGWRILPVWNSGEMKYSVLERDINQPMPPKCVVQVHMLGLASNVAIEHDILYQIVYEDGVTPEDGSATPLKSHDEVDSTGLIIGLPPR